MFYNTPLINGLSRPVHIIYSKVSRMIPLARWFPNTQRVHVEVQNFGTARGIVVLIRQRVLGDMR